jgi:AAA15 family ATPase/GTPase
VHPAIPVSFFLHAQDLRPTSVRASPEHVCKDTTFEVRYQVFRPSPHSLIISNGQALDFFHRTQLGFNDLIIKEKPFSDDVFQKMPLVTEEIKRNLKEKLQGETIVEPKTTHTIYDVQGNAVGESTFDKDKMESEGTKKVIEMSGPIFDTLLKGKLLIVDELDAKLHPLLTRSILQLFMDAETNPNGAQLIFATHDTNLLNLAYLRRDQIWFTEKDKTESSDLYSLVEFRDETGTKVRNDRSVEKDYINGRYGAIPFMN